MKAILILALSLISLPSLARIGETMEELTVRYGKAQPVNPADVNGPDSVWEFRKDGFTVWISLHGGRCDRIAFSKDNEMKLTPAELKTLLQASGRNKVWQGKAPDAKGVAELRTDDGSLEARVNETQTILFIRTKEASERVRQQPPAIEGK